MSNKTKGTVVEETAAATPAVAETEAPQAGPNYTIKLHRADHPSNRSSFTIPGHPGNVVFFNTLFAGGVPPQEITLSCEMVAPKADKAKERAEAIAKRAEEKARKAQERMEAAQRKAAEKAAKAEAQLAAARAKAEAATQS